MSTLKVDAIRHNSATSDAITTATDGTCSARITSVGGGQLSHRNIIINGSMIVAQRGTSSTVSGYATLDRFLVLHSGTDEAPTQAQADVASGTTPYTLGFRKSLKITNGNQTSGAGAGDYILINYKTESQDIAKSGWNYTDPNSKITFSYWVKSSVAQNFYVRVLSDDTTKQRYAFETGSLTADTWTKVTKTIPGNSNLVFNNDNGIGLYFRFYAFRGTDHTDNAVNLNQWETHNSSQNTPDQTATWYNTNDATFEITGLQLEVGPQATPFEHRPIGEELHLCQRYYLLLCEGATGTPNRQMLSGGFFYSDSTIRTPIRYPVRMRTTPSLETSNNTNDFKTFHSSNVGSSTNQQFDTFSELPYVGEDACVVAHELSDVSTQGFGCYTTSQNSTSKLALDAEF